MSDYDKIILEMKREDDIRNANQSLLNDGVSNPNVQSGGAAAAILHTEHPARHEKTWEEMDRVDQTIDALEAGYLGLKKAKKVAEMVDAFETSEAGFATLSEDIDGTDDESKKAVEALLSKDTQANRQYKNEASDRAMRSAFEYRALLQEDTKHRVPADIKAMQERTKDMGFWEALSEGAKLFLGGDVIGNSIYLAGTSFGAIAPYVVMAAVGNKAGAVMGGAAVGRAIGGVLMGYGSYQNEYGAYIAEKLQERGFNLSNPEDWKKAVRDQALIDDIKYRASNRAATVSAFDGLAGYAATLHFSPSQLTSKVRKAFGKAESELNGVKGIGTRLGDGTGNLVAQSGLQGVLGGAGEALGSLSAGDEVNAADVLMEVLGEFTSGPLDTLSLGVSSVKEYRNDIEKAEMAMQFEKAATQFSAAAEAISNDLKNEEAVDAWAERVGEDKSLIAFGQDVVDYVDMETLKQVDPELADEVVKAQEQKQSVEISVSRIAKIATKDRALANALIHEGKVDVAGMTPREAEEFEKTGKAEAQAQFDKILAKTKVSREQLKEAREVTAELSKQLQEAGADKQVADLQVKPWEMILANRARMLGESPKALAQRMNVRVVRGENGKANISFASPWTQGKYWSMGIHHGNDPQAEVPVYEIMDAVEDKTMDEDRAIFVQKLSTGVRNEESGFLLTGGVHDSAKALTPPKYKDRTRHLYNAVIQNLEFLVKNAMWLESSRDVQNKNPDVKGIHYFGSVIRVKGKDNKVGSYFVKFTVRDYLKNAGERTALHTIDGVSIESIPSVAKSAPTDASVATSVNTSDMPRMAPQLDEVTDPTNSIRVSEDTYIVSSLLNKWKRADGKMYFDPIDESSYQEDGAYYSSEDVIAVNQPAWHGSPHLFDEFSIDFIGSGEGAQAHGWGLYFAKSQAVAEGYRKRLTQSVLTYDGKELTELPEGIATVIKELERQGIFYEKDKEAYVKLVIKNHEKEVGTLLGIAKVFDDLIAQIDATPKMSIAAIEKLIPEQEKYRVGIWIDQAKRVAKQNGKRTTIADVKQQFVKQRDLYIGNAKPYQTFLDSVDKIDASKISVTKSKGRVFKVDIPEDEVLLDEQKSFEEQPAFVQEALMKLKGHQETMEGFVDSDGRKYVLKFAGKLLTLWYEVGENGGLTVIHNKQDNDALTDKFANTTHRNIEVNRFAGKDGREIYLRLVDELGSPKAASLALNKVGIKGVTYIGARDGRCFVVFDDKAVEVLELMQQNQGNRRGSYVPANTSTNTRGESGIISLMEKSDKSTFLHESAHAWLDFDTRLAMDIADKFDRGEALTEGEQEFLRTLGGFFKWGQQEGVINLGVTDDPVSVMRAARTWSQMSIQDQTAMHELFADGFERYMIDGSFPSLEVKNLFQRFKKWLLDVYKSVANQPKPISNDVKKLYDLLFVSEQEVNDAEIRAGMVKLFAADDAKIAMTNEERKQYDQLNEDANLEAQGIVSKAVSGVMRLYTKLRQKEAQSIYKANQKRIDNRIAELQEEPRYVALDILTKGLKQADGSKIRYKLNADALRAEGYSQETINTLAEKGFIYDGREHAKFISPRRLAEEVGAEDALDLIKQLAGDERAKNHSPLAKARLQLSWSNNFKLNARELKALGVDDETMAKLLERGYVIDPAVKPGTCSAQQLAEVSGHNFPAELIGELLDIQDVTQEATEQVAAEIKQETGESPEVYTQLQADLAAHNATRSKLLHAEHNAIARMLGKKQLAVQAAREYAQQKIQGMKLNELSAYIFIRNEKKCARLAEQAYIKGDFETCLEMKRGQILNMEMARAALEVQERYEKSVRMARNAVKSKTIHKPYQKLATLLIANHGITGTRGADIAAIAKESESLVKELEDNGTPIEGLQEALKDTTPIRDMTVEEADNLCSMIRELVALGRNHQKQQLLATKERIQDIVTEGKQLLEEAADAQGRDTKVEEVPKSKSEKVADWVKSFLFGHIKIATWCRIFDQNKENGFFWNLFIRSANERSDFEMTERARVAKRLSEILTPIFGNKGAFDQEKVRIGKKMMSKGERFAAACNLGNESNRKRLMDGDPEQWTEESIEELCSSLTKADWEAVQKIWDLFESYRPMIAVKQKRVYGEEPKWIEPSSFDVQTADGQTFTVRGGYYPVKYDPRSSNRADRQDDATKAAQELRGAFQSSTTNRSFTKARVESPNVGPLRLDMTALYNGLDDVIHDLAWHEWLIETRRVLSGVNGDGTGLRKVISERYGYHVAKAFEEWRQDIAQGSRIPGDGFGSKLIRSFSGNIGTVAMGWSPLSAIVQLTGIGYVVPRCGAKNTLEALKKFITNPVEVRKAINAASDMMANRALTMNKQVAEVKSRLESGKPNWLKEHAYCMIVAVQGMVDTIAWLAAYEKAINEESVINSENPDATAVAIANQVVIDTQSSGATHDMAAVERSEILGPFTVFYSWSNAALNQSYALAKGERNRGKAYRDLLWMGLFMPVLEKLVREMLKAEDEDEEDDEFIQMMKMPLQATLEYHAGLLVGVRELSGSVGSALTGERVFSYGGPAGTRGISAATQMLGNVSDPTSWSAVNSAIDVVGAFTGIPAGQIKKTIKGIRAIESGQAEGLDAIKAPIFGFTGKIED